MHDSSSHHATHWRRRTHSQKFFHGAITTTCVLSSASFAAAFISYLVPSLKTLTVGTIATKMGITSALLTTGAIATVSLPLALVATALALSGLAAAILAIAVCCQKSSRRPTSFSSNFSIQTG